jgi:NADH-quinone oxidoreductase subunit N
VDQLRLQASDLIYLAPELALVISAIVLSIIDLVMPKRVSRTVLGWLALTAVLISGVLVALQLNVGEPIVLLNQSFRVDDFANLFKLIFLTGTAFCILMSIGTVNKDDIPHTGEYYYLFLPAVLGAMIMASSGDLITLFVGLELLSITSYILVGMRKKNLKSNEGAFKYIVMGGISSAFILYGMSFLYGMTGSTNLVEINMTLITQSSFNALIYVSLFLILSGFGFKIAAAPFHTWAPDVYQGAPTPVAAFLAVVSKGAGLAVLFRMMYVTFFGLGHPDTTPIHTDVFFAITVLAAVAMIAGNLLALRQKNMKRLLAYSGVANSGYLLVPIGIEFTQVHFANFSELIYYLIAYLFMNLGAFAVVMAVGQSSGHNELSGFAGLYYRAPWTAIAMIILVLSLSGIPITAGFVGKLYILTGTLLVHKYWLATVMIGTSVISFYYYFGVIRQMFMRSIGETGEVKAALPLIITIWTSAIVTVLLGLFPQWILVYIDTIFELSQDFFLR